MVTTTATGTPTVMTAAAEESSSNFVDELAQLLHAEPAARGASVDHVTLRAVVDDDEVRLNAWHVNADGSVATTFLLDREIDAAVLVRHLWVDGGRSWRRMMLRTYRGGGRELFLD